MKIFSAASRGNAVDPEKFGRVMLVHGLSMATKAESLAQQQQQLDAPPAGEEAEAAAKPASRWAASSIMSLRATLRLVDMFGHKEADVDASAGAVQRAWRKRRQSVNLGAAEGLSEV